MRVPLSWLADFVALPGSAEELAETLTMGGLVVDEILQPSGGVRGVRVAEVLSVDPVEGSDKLSLVVASDGDDTLPVVCGASNFAVGDRVPWAKPGAQLPGGVTIGRKRLMGLESNGMLASARELGVGDDHRGLWVLEADAPLGADVSEWLGLEDEVLVLDLNPDRGYATAILGVARDVAALTGAALALPDAPPPPPGDLDVPVEIADDERCPRFDGRRISGVRVAASPAWLQRRLSAAGIRPLVNVVDATNYTMVEVGNPIHAYDTALLAGPRVEVRTARAGEKLRTLDGVERVLDPDDLVIADAEGPVALAGVMGGEATEIHEGTTDVFLETANFSASTVLRTARRHQLFTEGSKRWEKQVPPEHVPLAAGRCAELIVRLAGGQLAGAADRYPAPRQRETIRLRTERAAQRLGLALPAARQGEHLLAIGCEVGAGPDVLDVRPPAYRPDLRIEEDLYEEIARLEGYGQVPERVPSTGQIGGRRPEHEARRVVRTVLAGAGWTEVTPFPFIAPADLVALGLDQSQPLALVNPLSAEESALATTLLPGLLRVVRRNVNRQVADLTVFQTDRVFLRPTAEQPGTPAGPHDVTLPAEPLLLALAATGSFTRPRHDRAGRQADVFDVLGAVDVVRAALHLPALDVRPTGEAPYHPGRAARLALGGTDVGTVGELHPRVTAAFEVPARTVVAELRLDLLVAGGVRPPAPVAPSALPPLRFDVAVVVDAAVPAADVEAAVRAGAGPKLSGCELFDVFTGPQLGEGRKSLAYRLRLDDPGETLGEADERAAIEGVEASVAERVGGRLRRQ